jgi:hypothetical protein
VDMSTLIKAGQGLAIFLALTNPQKKILPKLMRNQGRI